MTTTISAGQGAIGRLWAILQQRCPRCFRGRIFSGILKMNDPCPACGQIFQREEGYFLGAMYVSYALGCGLVSVCYFSIFAIWPDLSPPLVCLGLFLGYMPLMPWIFRWSRVIWLHMDYLVSSGDVSAGSYEKSRRHQVSTTEPTSPGNPDGRKPRD